MFHVDIELDRIIEEALALHISDIHFEPQEENLVVRGRLDGILQHLRYIPKNEQEKLLNRIKIASSLDIGERRIPQDGRWLWQHKERSVQMRVSTMPGIWGEIIVLRLVDVGATVLTCAGLGMTSEVEKYVRSMLTRPYGLFLIAGQTGSGKTSTLYTLLQELNTGYKNIVCLENPVERHLKGINQVEINERAGLTFAKGLRAVLRQDPDVIMVGEIRDKETAQLAVQAALTGHFVLSTIHTNTAAAAIERLVDIGVDDFLVKAVLVGVLSQRLVRRPCVCGSGCEACKQTGYRGRVALYEILYVPPDGLQLEDISLYVKCSLAESAKQAVSCGLTTMEELGRLGIETEC